MIILFAIIERRVVGSTTAGGVECGAGGISRRPLRPIGKLLAEDTKRHHLSLILQHLFADGPASRADLARDTGLSRVTVSNLVGSPSRTACWPSSARRPRLGSASRRRWSGCCPTPRTSWRLTCRPTTAWPGP